MEANKNPEHWVDTFTNFLSQINEHFLEPMEEEYFLDVDYALEQTNRKREYEGKGPINRARLSKLTGIPYQSLVNFKAGKIPQAFKQLRALEELTGRKLDDLIKPKF